MTGPSLIFVFASLAAVTGSCIDIPFAQTSGSPRIICFGSQLLPDGSCCAGNILSSSTPGGPGSTPVDLLQAPFVTTPTAVTPVIGLSTQPIPAPRVIAQRCIYTKTVVKPQVVQRQIIVPKLYRYIKRTVTPVVETIAYKSTPVSTGNSSRVSGRRTLSSTCGLSGTRCASSCAPVFSRRPC